MRITVLELSSLLAYVPRVSSNKMQEAKNVMFANKVGQLPRTTPARADYDVSVDSHGSSATNVYFTLHLSLSAGHCSRPGPQ